MIRFLRRALLLGVFASVLSGMLLSGCGQFMGNLRHEDDSVIPNIPDMPEDASVTGGNWMERRYLEAENEDKVRGGSRPEKSLDSAEASTVIQRKRRAPARATRDDFVDQSQEEGSLWASNGQTNYYFTKNKIRSPGDIINLTVENELYRDIGVEIKQNLNSKEKAIEIRFAQEQLRNKYIASLKDTIPLSAAAPEKSAPEIQLAPAGQIPPSGVVNAANTSVAPAPLPSEVPLNLSEQDYQKKLTAMNANDIDIFSGLGIKAGDHILGEIIARYPNGNYKIKALKKIPYKRGSPRLVSVVGIVKSSDISEDTDTIVSGKLYEYRVESAN